MCYDDGDDDDDDGVLVVFLLGWNAFTTKMSELILFIRRIEDETNEKINK